MIWIEKGLRLRRKFRKLVLKVSCAIVESLRRHIMAWIKTIPEEEARGLLKALYEKIRQRRGSVADIYKLHSLHPESLEAHLNLYMTLMFGNSPLTRLQREMIATVVSTVNRCHY